MITKEQLVGLGLTEEQATKVISIHNDELSGNYIPKYRFDEVNENAKTLKESLSERDEQIKSLKKFEGTNEELSEKIKTLEADNKKVAQENEVKLNNLRKENAVKLELLRNTEYIPHNPDKVFKEFNLDTIVVDENGKITSGYKEQFDGLLASDGYLFKAIKKNTAQQPKYEGWKPVGAPPADGGNAGHVGDPAMDLVEDLIKW